MKTISFVNPNFQQGPLELNAYYLPYSVGTLWAYVNQFEEINTQYKLNRFVWRRDDVEQTAQALCKDTIVGFSVYVWNDQYCRALARRIKELNPYVLIIFGGPQPPIEKPEFFELFPYVDVCVKTEGEISFRRILETYPDSLKHIPGLLLNDNLNVYDTGPAERITDLSVLPSPYLEGYFDHLLTEYPDITWNGTLETNRGCPYACTFCDWGSLTYTKIKKFDLERVYAELEWFGERNIDFISITDANFGIFPERDMDIATKLVEVQQHYGAPRNYTISWAKNQRAEVIDIVKKLVFEGGTTAGLNLSVQTLDEKTLEIIKRKNLAMNKVEEVFDACELNSIPLYTELILGLPGETMDSWKKNFWGLYESGNHTGITVYQAQLLENAEMNLTQRNLYCLEGQPVYDYLPRSETDPNLIESVDIVVSTLDLPHQLMLDAQVFSWFQVTFHIGGISNYVARFMHKYLEESYQDFYDKFFVYAMHDDWIHQEHDLIRELYNRWMTTGRIGNVDIEGIQIHGWNLIHSTTIKIHSHDKMEHIHGVLYNFVMDTYADRVPKELLKSLLHFQSTYLIQYKQLRNYPVSIKIPYDFMEYLQTGNNLETPTSYLFDFPEDKNMSLKMFCEHIFYARRKNFGKAWITKMGS